MTREELKEYLPHREPMLLVDEITMDENNVAHGIYHVRGDEFFLQGHFPGQPVVPGVILCEIIAQPCALLLGDALKGKIPFYTGIDKVKFKHLGVGGMASFVYDPVSGRYLPCEVSHDPSLSADLRVRNTMFDNSCWLPEKELF